MTTFLALLEAIIALPKIGALVETAIQAVVAWYCAKQNTDTLSAIADAAALAARASTDEERFHAADQWRKALSRSRISA